LLHNFDQDSIDGNHIENPSGKENRQFAFSKEGMEYPPSRQHHRMLSLTLVFRDHTVGRTDRMAPMQGSDLSLMIECIASLTAANPVIAPALGGRAGTNINGVDIALDIAAYGDRVDFLDDVDALGRAIAAQLTAPGTQRLLLPGERGDAARAEREHAGIPLPSGTWSGLAAVAAEPGVAMPVPLAGV
jgi:hypothetical protein